MSFGTWGFKSPFAHYSQGQVKQPGGAAIARYDGIRLVEDSRDIETCEGAATIGLELVGTVPSFDAVLIALGGGALATGVGHVVKSFAPEVEVICVQPLGAPAMTHSWRQRRVVTTDSTNTIADAVAGRHVVTIVCGRNVDADAYHHWVGAAPIDRS